jgi:hypothetical protein
MVQRFIAWWIRNAAYIGPVANCFSALAALLSVYMVTKTFRQARRDRKEELEAKHPRFKVLTGAVTWREEVGGDHTISPFFELLVTIQNVREHSAKRLHLRGTIYLDLDKDSLFVFEQEPVDDIEKDSTITASLRLLTIDYSDKPYIVRIALDYRDARTGIKHPQTLYRKFYLQSGEDVTVLLLPLDRSEVSALASGQSVKMQRGLIKK